METVDLKARQSISNAVICASYMSNNYMYVILCCTKIEHPDKGHDFRAVSGAFFPNLYYSLIIAMNQDLLSRPMVAPGVHCRSYSK